ncbi:MAG TPA: acetyl-CoA carboxylase biotin carboxyl carrier protein subunit [Longimicrobiales bacterium]
MSTFRFTIEGHDFETHIVRRQGSDVVVSVNGREYTATLQPRWSDLSEDHPLPPAVVPPAPPARKPQKTATQRAHAGVGVVTAPLPGLLLRIPVTLGDRVKRGQTVAVIEAMKMELSIGATIDGIVSSIAVEPGATVPGDAELVWIQAAEQG